MFRRLAETFVTDPNGSIGSNGSNKSNEGFSPHSDYVAEQQSYYAARPNIIPSATSGLKGFDKAIQTATTYTGGRAYQDYAVDQPNQIFMQPQPASLSARAAHCASGSIDDLIAEKNPNERVGCGWIYTPNRKSPYPTVSRGALGTREGPSAAFDTPDHKKWFFNLENAKREILLDKCNSLKSCADVESAPYNGVCGFCADTNQGIPIDAKGVPLYDGVRGGCSSGSIMTNKGACPVPQVDGPRAIVDRTCEPVNGRLSQACMHQQVISAGCNEKGALATALAGSREDMQRVADSYSVKLYNRVAAPPLQTQLFTDGNATVNTVLQEARQLAANTSRDVNTALGAAARDLCLQRGAINGYDACMELTDASTGPFDLRCLQRIFLQLGGTQRATLYPTDANLATYNNQGTLGAIKQRWMQRLAAAKGGDHFTDYRSKTASNAVTDHFVDYETQKAALQDMLGIVPEEMITRAPYKQGVEVFWFIPGVMQPGVVNGFLKRTVETKMVQYADGPSYSNQLGTRGYAAMLQLTDLRAPTDFSTRMQIRVDDGGWAAVNHPVTIDESAMKQIGYTVDSPGFLENMGLQGPTSYAAQSCTPFHASTPNIMKLYHQDAGGGWAAFQFGMTACAGTPATDPMYLSLTCEPRAPFLRFEVSGRSRFEELRNPGLFGQFVKLTGLDIHSRTDEQQTVPGKKSFVRVNNANSMINLENIAYQSWVTMTVAVRFQSMPVKESILNLASGRVGSYYNVIAYPINGSTAGISIEHNVTGRGTQTQSTTYGLALNVWYLIRIDNTGTGFTIHCDAVDDLIRSKGSSRSSIALTSSKPLWGVNGTWKATPGQSYEVCNVMLGTNGVRGSWAAMYASGACTYDVAWVHFFDGLTNDNDIYRECKCDWVYTQFPSAYDTYSS